MKQIVECIANFSEGRNPSTIGQIVQAIEAVSNSHVLKYESDADHNRSVITFIGTPEGIVESAFEAIRTAAEHINMDTHQGEHPRLGATDVVPFVPIQGVTMADCVELARKLGQRVGDELKIPVYLYEKAATRPDRVNLAHVRKGEYELLKQEIATNPDRIPDFGPAEVGKAGATIIGARAPLIAYNIYLETDNVEIAQKVAKAVRGSSGGLRSVKGLGMLVEGKAQVSMNLVDYTDTPVYRAVEMIRREAARYGVNVASSELIGLIPQDALFDAAQWYMQIDNFTREQVLEVKVAAFSRQADETPDFINALSSSDPTPGGGSAAAYGGAMAAALVGMVARLTLGKKKYADVQDRMAAIIIEADTLRDQLRAGVEADAEAFNGVMAAFRLPKDDDTQKIARDTAIQQATYHATEVPLETARMAGRVLELVAEVAEGGNVNAISDAGSAGALAQATLYAAGMNVKINAATVTDPDKAQAWLGALADIEANAQESARRIYTAIKMRGGIG